MNASSSENQIIEKPGHALKNPILHIAASFWEEDRLDAFKVCYDSMRSVDDLVDNLKSSGAFSDPSVRERTSAKIRKWVADPGTLGEKADSGTFKRTIAEFKIPFYPWTRLAKAMEYDVHHERFESMGKFLKYTRGAAVAPATVFLHLISLTRNGSVYQPGARELRPIARPLAVFSYMVHIMRDFRADTHGDLDYFPIRFKKEFNVTDLDISRAADGDQSRNFDAMVKRYWSVALRYFKRARREADIFSRELQPRYKFSLGLIQSMYELIFRRFEENNFQLDPDKINLDSSAALEVTQRLAQENNLPNEILENGLIRLGELIEA
ncbi:MAG: squalene/phytoene synthase family protein [candidate division Zixibacteria bacterium]|nr:squalene/phytoene synthase family protein [candidate division Zixibacteria bacterium]